MTKWQRRLAGLSLILAGLAIFFVLWLAMQPGGEHLLARRSAASHFVEIVGLAAVGLMVLASSGKRPPKV